MSVYGYLAHHGIKGQKWGIRRYENYDGTLTEEGKKRYYLDTYKPISYNGNKKWINEAALKSDIKKMKNNLDRGNISIAASMSYYHRKEDEENARKDKPYWNELMKNASKIKSAKERYWEEDEEFLKKNRDYFNKKYPKHKNFTDFALGFNHTVVGSYKDNDPLYMDTVQKIQDVALNDYKNILEKRYGQELVKKYSKEFENIYVKDSWYFKQNF